MKKVLARAAAGTFALVMLSGSGVAYANPYDPYAGQTYAKVVERTNGRAVIANRVGSYLPTDECIVTGSRRTTFADSSGNGQTKLLVDLNCNEIAAVYGHPGNSVTSPQGQRAKKRREAAVQISNNFAKATEVGKQSGSYCAKNAENCVKICQEARNCSDALVEFLGL